MHIDSKNIVQQYSAETRYLLLDLVLKTFNIAMVLLYLNSIQKGNTIKVAVT